MTFSKRTLYSLFVSTIAILIAGCSPNGLIPNPSQDQTASAPNPLVNTQWSLVSFEEQGTETPPVAATELTLEFDETGQATGSGGCNTFGAQYGAQNGQISITQLTTTEIACTTEGVMEQERRYYDALQSAGEYELSGDQLKIYYGNGQGVLNFASQAP
jgi:heat shock protein HslJ